MRPIRAIALLAAMLVAVSPVTAQDVRFPSVAIPGSVEPATINAAIYKPPGSGPFPTVIVLHGCGGPDSHHKTWAERLVSWGYAAVVPDSFGSRGHKSLCEKVTLVPPRVRVADVAGTAQFLATQPFVSRGRIGVIGFSHGGWTVMKGVQAESPWSAAGIRGGVAYYPQCEPQSDRNVALPLLILMGDRDDWTPAERCKGLIAAGMALPSLVEAVYYPDAYHGFDRNQRTIWVQGQGPNGITGRKMEYSASATRDAESRTRAFFDRLLR